MEQSKLEKLLAEYVSDTTNANILFQLALCYDELEQISPAISFYHICAENAENVTLKYECMLRAGLLTRKQENRLYTEKSFFQNAICIKPDRIEAYIYMADTLLKLDRRHDALNYLCIAECFYNINNVQLMVKLPNVELQDLNIKKIHFAKMCGVLLND